MIIKTNLETIGIFEKGRTCLFSTKYNYIQWFLINTEFPQGTTLSNHTNKFIKGSLNGKTVWKHRKLLSAAHAHKKRLKLLSQLTYSHVRLHQMNSLACAWHTLAAQRSTQWLTAWGIRAWLRSTQLIDSDQVESLTYVGPSWLVLSMSNRFRLVRTLPDQFVLSHIGFVI